MAMASVVIARHRAAGGSPSVIVMQKRRPDRWMQLDRIRRGQQAAAMQPYPHHVSRHEATVLPEWIDYNGHMNLAYYVVVFDLAADTLFEKLEIGHSFRVGTPYTTFAAETHTRYEREVKLGDRVTVFSHLLGADAKRIYCFHEMFHTADGYRAATQEVMSLHVSLETRRVTALPDDKLSFLRRFVTARGDAPLPPEAGRRIAMPG
jgi:acyl-CoA thioester hydrolase